MTYSVYQHWDPLRVMAVGKSYPPEIYDYIKNERVRKVFYRIAEETEEDYQKLVSLLEKFNVQVFRPDIESRLEQVREQIKNNQVIESPIGIMQPRDFSIMLGNRLYWGAYQSRGWEHVINHAVSAGAKYERIIRIPGSYSDIEHRINAAMTTRVGRDLYVGIYDDSDNHDYKTKYVQSLLPEYRIHVLDTYGHSDGTFTPVVPGLIISIMVDYSYNKTFPDWEVVYLHEESWYKMGSFLDLKKQNNGKWWVPGEELNEDFTRFVEQWMNNWVGYVEESVFDVNMIVIDKQNVIVNGYNREAFDALSRYGITPHICNFRHRYFWDGGLHCITSDLHREGIMEDYFPERG